MSEVKEMLKRFTEEVLKDSEALSEDLAFAEGVSGRLYDYERGEFKPGDYDGEWQRFGYELADIVLMPWKTAWKDCDAWIKRAAETKQYLEPQEIFERMLLSCPSKKAEVEDEFWSKRYNILMKWLSYIIHPIHIKVLAQKIVNLERMGDNIIVHWLQETSCLKD